jgi:hypothetical protein
MRPHCKGAAPCSQARPSANPAAGKPGWSLQLLPWSCWPSRQWALQRGSWLDLENLPSLRPPRSRLRPRFRRQHRPRPRPPKPDTRYPIPQPRRPQPPHPRVPRCRYKLPQSLPPRRWYPERNHPRHNEMATSGRPLKNYGSVQPRNPPPRLRRSQPLRQRRLRSPSKSRLRPRRRRNPSPKHPLSLNPRHRPNPAPRLSHSPQLSNQPTG